MPGEEDVHGSFRDPCGFLFYRHGTLYRQINTVYKENYDYLMGSGLYEALVGQDLLVAHREADVEGKRPAKAYKVIEPDSIPFISYPYEWCFSQLKHAALTTLEIQKTALAHRMSLKDCSVYNIQFKDGKPIFIDSLSFEKYEEGRPWIAYAQFCRHFLAPLALMRCTDYRLNQLFRVHIDGVPLDLASNLLPFSSKLKFSLLSHIHLHAKSQRHFARKTVDLKRHRISLTSFLGLIDSLQSAVEKLEWLPVKTEWGDYYEDNSYSSQALGHKEELVADYLNQINPQFVCDLGANTGRFSRIASDRKITTLSVDADHDAVEKNYVECVNKNETSILPLLLDLTNPSAGVGWENRERAPFFERCPVDTMFALALIHHLAISNNLPLGKIASFFSRICRSLIIEFVPKEDVQVQRLLSTREDIFPDYTGQAFEDEFGKYFAISDKAQIKDSERTLYLLRRRIG